MNYRTIEDLPQHTQNASGKTGRFNGFSVQLLAVQITEQRPQWTHTIKNIDFIEVVPKSH